ncbi:peptidase S24 [Pseudomonas fragi]|nr:peptidase S24 [Pseudomonas fragi]
MGFPNPAQDHLERQISLDDLLRLREPSVYLFKMGSDAMTDAGIFAGDICVVDRAINPVHGHIVQASVNGEPFCRRLWLTGGEVKLISESPKGPARYILEADELQVFGVVTYSVRCHEVKS